MAIKPSVMQAAWHPTTAALRSMSRGICAWRARSKKKPRGVHAFSLEQLAVGEPVGAHGGRRRVADAQRPAPKEILLHALVGGQRVVAIRLLGALARRKL